MLQVGEIICNAVTPNEHLSMISSPSQSQPYEAGKWWFRASPAESARLVIVEETVAAGRFCRELRQGGSRQVGFAPWSGIWKRANQ